MTDETEAESTAVAGTGKLATDMKDIAALMPEVRLTRDDALRSAALVMALRYHLDTIVRDGELYREMSRDSNHKWKTTAPQQVVDAAVIFEAYLRGDLGEMMEVTVDGQSARSVAEAILDSGGGEGPAT